MSISIIIPSLNAPTIQATLDSLYAQTCYDKLREVIVVGRDDGRYIKTHPLLRFIETPQPLAPAEARNLGAAESSGEIIAFIDADVVLMPPALATLCDILAEADVACGSIIFETGDYWRLVRNIMSFSFYTDATPREARDYLPSYFLVMHRKVWDVVGGFDTSFRYAAGEDVEWGVRATYAGYCLIFEPGARSYHRPVRVNGLTAMKKLHQYGASWGLVYERCIRGRNRQLAYVPRARIEYLLQLLEAGRRRQIASKLILAWSWLWIITALPRDVLLVYMRRPVVRPYLHATPGLLLLFGAWYGGLLAALRKQGAHL